MAHTNRLELRLDDDTATKLDQLRRRTEDLPNRSEMIRRLIHEAHDTAEAAEAAAAKRRRASK